MCLAFYNTKTNEIVSRGLSSDMVDYHLYQKNKINDNNLKVIKNPLDNELEIKNDGGLIFKDGNQPQFLGLNY